MEGNVTIDRFKARRASVMGGREWIGRLCFVVAACLIIFAPFLGLSPSMLRQLVFLALALMVVTGLNISLGYAGEMSLGQSFLVASGAYVIAILATAFPSLPLPLHLVVAGITGAVVGLLVGIPGLRLGAWSLAIVTFLTVLILPDILTLFSKYTGGLLGLAGLPLATLGGVSLPLEAFYSAVMVVLIGWILLYRNLILSRWAVLLLTMRASPISAHALGISVYRMKLLVYVISAIPASIAGALLTFHTGFIGPELFNLERSIGYLASLILGGVGSIYGPIVGTIVVELAPFHTGVFERYALMAFGALLIIGSVLVPGGIAAALRRMTAIKPLANRRYAIRSAAIATEPANILEEDFTSSSPATLSLNDVTVSFGSAVVLNKVGFTIGKGVTGLIGPNGSGKTTLLNATSGFVPLRSGTITLNGERLSGLASWKRARLGLARTFQTPKLPKDVLVVEAIAAAAFRSKSILLATMFRTTAWRRLEAAELARAHAIAKIVGLGDVTLKRIDEIAAGQQRLVDIARAIMTRPKVLLLDEPAAGLSDAEVAQLRQLLLRLGQSGLTVVLIDHNLPFVSTTCERAIVLDAGVLIYEGRADCVADDPAVREAYVGIS